MPSIVRLVDDRSEAIDCASQRRARHSRIPTEAADLPEQCRSSALLRDAPWKEDVDERLMIQMIARHSCPKAVSEGHSRYPDPNLTLWLDTADIQHSPPDNCSCSYLYSTICDATKAFRPYTKSSYTAVEKKDSTHHRPSREGDGQLDLIPSEHLKVVVYVSNCSSDSTYVSMRLHCCVSVTYLYGEDVKKGKSHCAIFF